MMIVPQFWAEGRVQRKEPGRQVTVRRFGWSDNSQEDAQAKADVRAAEALQRVWSGEKLDRREAKVAYNGAEGVPIREEIVARQGELIVTRNGYGALCLNTPNVMFVDIDAQDGAPCGVTLAVIGLLIAASAIYGMMEGSWRMFFGGIGMSLILGGWVAGALFRLYERVAGGPKKRALTRIRKFSEGHLDWHLRVYETPAGYRLMVMHDLFDPNEERVQACFKAVGTDETFVRMCQRQHCFRARVSPKPWRIGMKQHILPVRGGWPVRPELLPLREQWVKEYEEKAAAFASCLFGEQLGSLQVHPEAEALMRLHDEMARAHSGLKMA